MGPGRTRNARPSWQVTSEVVKTPLLAFAVLVIMIAVGELAAHTPFVTTLLLAPSVGSPARNLDTQLERLRAFASAGRSIDCVFLGSSQVLRGIDPAIFAAAYANRSGRTIRCFNLGVPGATVTTVAALAPIVVADYHPWLIVYGANAWDFSAAAQEKPIHDIPWIKYRSGMFTLDGWLTDTSRAYRYYLTYRSRPPSHEKRSVEIWPSVEDGFRPDDAVASPTDRPGALQSLVLTKLGTYQVSGLAELLDVAGNGVQVGIMEFPDSMGLIARFGDLDGLKERFGEYDGFRAGIRQASAEHRVPYWGAPSPELIPDDGWGDLVHLNSTGAAALSRWLGEHVAESVERGELTPPLRREREAR